MSYPKHRKHYLMLPGKAGTDSDSCNYSLGPAQCLIKRNFHHPKGFLVSKKAPFHPQRCPQKQTDKSSFLAKFCRKIKFKQREKSHLPDGCLLAEGGVGWSLLPWASLAFPAVPSVGLQPQKPAQVSPVPQGMQGIP